jgi:inosine-uridine nucleoside N-ribohydrolase
MAEERKILIDCDTGTDDAIAIIAALYSDNADVVAITTVNGNVPLKYTSQNTLDLVDCLGFLVPVAIGANAPLKRHVEIHNPDGTHGNTGLGTLRLPKAQASFYEKNAIDTILYYANEANGSLEIVAIGPLTNIGIAFLMYPELKNKIKNLWIMGGAASGGNMNATAEFNIWTDPEAARIVFGSGVPISMVGLDVTEKAILNEEDRDRIGSIETCASKIICEILLFMFKRRNAQGEDAMMHDALALAAALCPECLEFKKYFVDVECEGSYTFGHTFVDTRERLGRIANANVAMRLNLPIFKNWLYKCLENSAK